MAKRERLYTFNPVGWDVFDARANTPAPGTIVRKVQPHGCPRNGTMGHCYVEPCDETGASVGRFALVLLASLEPFKLTRTAS